MAEKDATTTTQGSQEAESTTESSSESTGTTESDVIASYRKRQAGAEAARVKAEEKLKEALAELEPLRAKSRSAADNETASIATLQAKLDEATRRADEAEAKAEAKVLDARFPNARKELPEVTDEVRLAKFEAMLADDEEVESPPVRRPNGPQNQGSGNEEKPETSADIEARLRKQAVPWA